MHWFITYFYNYRFLKPNQVVFSTAMYPPKWFSEKGIIVDNNYVVRGLSCDDVVPRVHADCPCKVKKPSQCEFVKAYKEQLNSIDFDRFIDTYEDTARRITDVIGEHNPQIVLLVFEKPDNPCSERWALMEWFEKHGQLLDELEIEK